MSTFKLKSTHAPVKAYYETLEKCAAGRFDNEGNIRRAFESLLEKCARPFERFVVGEYQIVRSGKSPLRVDAAVLDAFNLPRGYWEAKDEKDDLKAEMNKKFAAGYPQTNILFQAPTRAILVQDGRIAFNDDISDPEKLVDVLRLFFEWQQPHQEDWDRAVREFSERIPEIAKGAMTLIEGERKSNPAFVERFTAFAELCRESINPDLKDEAVEEMLVQHLLTERIFRRIFDNPEFTRRNVIAAEIEKVIDSLTKKHFSRDSFLRDLDPFYKAIEETASIASDYSEKQAFLNKVYERFFQGFNRKQADTHGIVYTPQPIVDFMVRSVEEVLKVEFGRSLSDKGVHILDPFVGTGNFITRVMKEIKTSSLPHKYKEELHCNEIMLLPYYIASMNIEHAYLDKVGEYEPFEGICLVDTFELAEAEQTGFSFMAEENTKRVRRQKAAPIKVIIGNPPYNANQHYENEGNRNRRYKVLSARVAATYGKDSQATNKNTLSDPYIGALRWASDRLGDEGVIALVTNNSFVDSIAADGVRKNLRRDFDRVFVLDLGGDVRRNPKLSGTAHNVFGIQVGVSISLFVRHGTSSRPGEVRLGRVDEYWKKREKFAWLEKIGVYSRAGLIEVKDNPQNRWVTGEGDEEYSRLLPLIASGKSQGIFADYSNGAQSNRDPWVFNFNRNALLCNMERFIATYNSERVRWNGLNATKAFETSILKDDDKIKWCSKLKQVFENNIAIDFNPKVVATSQYRPFTTQFLYNDRLLIHRPGQVASFFTFENQALVVTSHSQVPFLSQAVDRMTCLDVGGRPSQVFPFFVYDDYGTNRRENITDWALAEFRKHYGDNSIGKWDIFHYTYGLLHHPEYRTRYAANLKRELPRIPMAPGFRRFAEIGAALMKLHIDYETQAEYPLERTETGRLNWRVEKMTLSKDKTQLKYNEFLTLSGIPPEVYEYRLGNRSALEWVVDQYFGAFGE
jgi:predicted helicase